MSNKIEVVNVPYTPGPEGQARHLGTLGPGLDVSFKLVVPADAKVGANGSLEIYPWPDQIDKAGITMAMETGINDPAAYGFAEKTFHFTVQSEFGPPPPPDPTSASKPLKANTTYYFNVTIAHDGKQGKPYGGDPTPRTIAAEFRTPQ